MGLVPDVFEGLLAPAGRVVVVEGFELHVGDLTVCYFKFFDAASRSVVGDFSISCEVEDGEADLTLRAGVENLFDKRYTTYADWCDIPQKGRNVYVNVSLRLTP